MRESQFGKWHVSVLGEMSYDNGRYFIDSNRLKNDDWIIHLQSKGWIDWNEFIPAYLQALQNAKIQIIKIKTFY